MSPSFIAFDFELANSSHASACAVGWVRVADGQIVRRAHRFIRPVSPFDATSDFNLALTGISAHEIAGGESFATLGPRLARHLEGQIAVVHNASADLSMWEQSWWAAGLGTAPTFRFIDTVKMAHSLGYPGKLHELYEHLFDRPMAGAHHNALDDTVATAEIALELLQRIRRPMHELVNVRRPKQHVALKPPRGPLRPLPTVA